MDTTIEREEQTTLAQLLERVARGERITITENGVPVAVMDTAEQVDEVRSPERRQQIREAIEAIKEIGSRNSLGGLSIREMIEEGRA